MTIDKMKLAVCEKMPKLIELHTEFCEGKYKYAVWNRNLQTPNGDNLGRDVHWPTEGLQVCHEAENMLTNTQKQKYGGLLQDMSNEAVVGYVPDYNANLRGLANIAHATYEQRLEALCRVWFPERFTKGGDVE